MQALPASVAGSSKFHLIQAGMTAVRRCSYFADDLADSEYLESSAVAEAGSE